MSYDLNDTHQPPMGHNSEPIPDGTFAKLQLTIIPGGVDGPKPLDAGLLKASRSSDAAMLHCECTVLEGPHARRKFWHYFTVRGGRLDKNGQSIGLLKSLATFRDMLDSAHGLDPMDYSPAAKTKRVLPGLKHLDGIIFAGRITVEPPFKPQYRAENRLASVVLPGEPQYAPIMQGQTLQPEPVNAPQRKPESTQDVTLSASVPTPQTMVGQTPGSAPAEPSRASTTGMPTWLNG